MNEILSLTDAFEAAMSRSACQSDPGWKPAGSPASYISFDFNPGPGRATFSNSMLLDLSRDEHKIRISKRHEGVHAIQWNAAPALHASPYNRASPYILSPESWVLATILTERDAFAKTALLNALDLVRSPDPDFAAQAALEGVVPADIDSASSDIRAALQRASLAWDGRLRSNKYQQPGQASVTLMDHYISSALNAYERGMNLRLSDPSLPPPIYVRLADEDIMAIGASFGPSTFGAGHRPDQQFRQLPPLSFELQQRLDAIKARFGLYADSALPSLAEASAQRGSSPEAFMAQSKAYQVPLSPDAPSLVA